jgi:hypothetical protein
MTERTILAGTAPNLVIKAGVSVTVKSWTEEKVMAKTENGWGLKVEQRNSAEFARARAAVGEHVLFDVRFENPLGAKKKEAGEVIEVQIGGSGEVWAPEGANVKIYAGKNIEVQSIRGQVDAYAGWKIVSRDVTSLGAASAGWTMDLDCQTLAHAEVEFKAGSDIRLYVHDLTSAYIRVKDIGGYWEGRIGGGEKSVSLKCGGDVTLVTDQVVEPLPPNYILGQIEKPPAS